MSNLKLWNKVDKTDPKFTKSVSMNGGYTAIAPQYQLKKATEQFGPYGKGFGLSSSEMDFSLIEKFGAVFHKAVFFYVIEGERQEFPISNSAKIVTGKNNYFDDDFAKKIETNTVSKALSKIGFCADVFMGMFDLPGYAEHVSGEIGQEEAIKESETIQQEQEEYKEWLDKALGAFKHLNTDNALRKHYNGAMTKASKQSDNNGMKAIEDAYNTRAVELTGGSV